MKRLLLILVGLLIGLAALGFAGWRSGLLPWFAPPPKSNAQNADAGRRGDGMTVVTVRDIRIADVPVTLDGIGTVTPLESVLVRTQVDGRLMSLAFTEGQDVRAGDVLAQVDPTIYQAQYDLAVAKKAQNEAALANARVDLDRYKKLASGNFGTKQQADTQAALVMQLEAQTRQDQATIDNTQAYLNFTTIRSPLDGRTGIRLVDPGNIVQAGSASGIVVVTKLRPIAIVFTVAQQNVRNVTTALANGSLNVQALDADNKTIIETGVVSVVDNQIDPTTGAVKIKAQFSNAALVLWPGQFSNVRLFVTTLKDAIVVPTVAVQRGPSGAYVYVLQTDGTVVQTNVTIGQQTEAQSVVTSGLKPPGQVVVSGFARLTNGAKVRVIDPGAKGETAESKQGASDNPTKGSTGDKARPPSDDKAAPSAQSTSDAVPSPGKRGRGERTGAVKDAAQ